MKEEGFKFLDHTADIYIKAYSKTLEGAFEQVVYSLMTTISPNLKLILPKKKKIIEIVSEDMEALLFDFLSEFLYIFDVEELVFSSVKVKRINKKNDNYKLEAIAKGEVFNIEKHEVGTEVKAITYNMMKIEEKKNKIEIDVVFDI
ncbi:MAG: archease [Promethearchaeota archaeon]